MKQAHRAMIRRVIESVRRQGQPFGIVASFGFAEVAADVAEEVGLALFVHPKAREWSIYTAAQFWDVVQQLGRADVSDSTVAE